MAKQVARLRLGLNTFGIGKSDPTKLPQPVPSSKDFIFTSVMNDVSSQTNSNPLPPGILNTPFYITGISAGYRYILSASLTINRVAPVYFEFSFNQGDIAARQNSRFFYDADSNTTENHFRGLFNSDTYVLDVPIFIPNSLQFFYIIFADSIDQSLVDSSELFFQIYGRFV